MKESKFSGSFFGYAWVNFVYYASIILTANVAMPFGLCYRERWLAKHTVINGKQLDFYGSATKLFLKKRFFAIIGPILLAMAAGLFFTRDRNQGMGAIADGTRIALLITVLLGYLLYTAWLSRRMKKWIIKYTRFT